MSHGRAAALMVLVALLWSIAGVVTRQLHSAAGWELTFWRSASNAAALVLLLCLWRGARPVWATFRHGGAALWISGAAWAVMYTAFMLALNLTTVANTLVTMALAPLFTALLARAVLCQPLPLRTWVASLLAGAGIGWMQAGHLGASGADGSRHLLGMAVALLVPVAAAVNWTLVQHLQARHGQLARHRSTAEQATPVAVPPRDDLDMLCGVLLGALISAALALPLAWPLRADSHDIAWLALLGVLQLAVPCLLAVVAARTLKAPEVALLALLEVVFGVAWAWWGGGEAPGAAVLGGGALVLLALAGNEVLALRHSGKAASGAAGAGSGPSVPGNRAA